MFAEVKGFAICALTKDQLCKCINIKCTSFVHKVEKACRSVQQSQQSIPGKSGSSEDPYHLHTADNDYIAVQSLQFTVQRMLSIHRESTNVCQCRPMENICS